MGHISNQRSDVTAWPEPYLDFYNEYVTNEDITGFEGAELFREIVMVGNFVNGVPVKVREY